MLMQYAADIKKTPRSFLPVHFVISDWDSLAPFFLALYERTINNVQELEQWLRDASELEAVISEDASWRQIKMTCDTENKTLEESFNYFMLELQPRIQPWSDKLNRKLVSSPYLTEADRPVSRDQHSDPSGAKCITTAIWCYCR
jgi:oligoendopeptidase F